MELDITALEVLPGGDEVDGLLPCTKTCTKTCLKTCTTTG
jgi:hypothetical protein